MLEKREIYDHAIKGQEEIVRDHIMGVIDKVISNRLELTKIFDIHVNSHFYREMSLNIKKVFDYAVEDYFKG